MKIDFHCHSFPAEFFRALKRHYPDVIALREDAKGGLVGVWAKTPLPAWDHDGRLDDIDRAEIDGEILSHPPIHSPVHPPAPQSYPPTPNPPPPPTLHA